MPWSDLNQDSKNVFCKQNREYLLMTLMSLQIGMIWIKEYRIVFNIRRTLVGKKIVDHSDRRCSNYIFILNLTPGFNGLGKDNCKTRRETFMFWDWVRLILDNLRYYFVLWSHIRLTSPWSD